MFTSVYNSGSNFFFGFPLNQFYQPVAYRASPAAFNFVLLRPPGFVPTIPAGFIYPVEVIEKVMTEGQQAGIIREGQPNLLTAIFLGCILRPIIVSIGSAPGAFDLLSDYQHDAIIQDASWYAVVRP